MHVCEIGKGREGEREEKSEQFNIILYLLTM